MRGGKIAGRNPRYSAQTQNRRQPRRGVFRVVHAKRIDFRGGVPVMASYHSDGHDLRIVILILVVARRHSIVEPAGGNTDKWRTGLARGRRQRSRGPTLRAEIIVLF